MALGTQPHGKMLDYEQFIDHQLARTQAKIKTTDILIGCLTLATAFIAVLFLEIVLDHAVGLPIWVRRIILLAGMAGAAVYSGYRIARPFLRRVNGFYAAKTIEETDPHFKNSLINYLDLRKHRDELPKRVLRAIEAKAVGDLTKVEIETVVNQKRVLHTWYALMGVIMVVFIYYGFAPKSVLDSAKRAFLADVVRPTNTRLDSIKPGDDPELSEVVAGIARRRSRSRPRASGPRRSRSTTASTAASSTSPRTSRPARTCSTPGRPSSATSSSRSTTTSPAATPSRGITA